MNIVKNSDIFTKNQLTKVEGSDLGVEKKKFFPVQGLKKVFLS